MKLILHREKGGWLAGINRGKGGISSLFRHRWDKSLWGALKVFRLSNFILYFQK